MIANRALMTQSPLVPRPRGNPDKESEYESRVLLTAADATVVLVDRQLRRLQAAADLYRERLEAGMESTDEAE